MWGYIRYTLGMETRVSMENRMEKKTENHEMEADAR